jgi:hypothetical protein
MGGTTWAPSSSTCLPSLADTAIWAWAVSARTRARAGRRGEGVSEHAVILTVRRAARQGYGADAKARERREDDVRAPLLSMRGGDKPPRYRFIRAPGLRKQAELQILGA